MTAADAGRVSDADRQAAYTLIDRWDENDQLTYADLAHLIAEHVAAERARAVADLRAAVEKLAEELANSRAHGASPFDNGYHRATVHVADRLRAVLAATSEEQQP